MNNNEYFEYEEEKKQFPWKRVLIILLLLIVVVIVVLLLIKGCGSNKLDKTLLQAGKDYYTKYPEQLPTEAGECYTVDLDTLEKENLIKNTKSYQTCDNENTYVKVCYLEGKTYHYVAILSCDEETSKFGIWADGLESNIIADISDVRFKFQGEELNTGTKYYYPNNSTDASTVKEYYKSSPADLYTGKEDEATGYKWYTTGTSNAYWNNGEYSSTQPSGYTNKGASTSKSYYTIEEPSSQSYRKITGTKDLYHVDGQAFIMGFFCKLNSNDENSAKHTTTPCSDTKLLVRIEYTCDGNNEVAGTTQCTEWLDSCPTSKVSGVNVKCTSAKGYSYTDTMWKWYKTVNTTSYYPSGNQTADKEKTYYTSAPISGAIRDDSTVSTVYKYYKLEKNTGTGNNYEEWMPITDGYVDENEMISKFKEKGYEVFSLKDINNNDNIRYQLQLQYRNPVE